jgi:hypothetical protein
LELIRLTGTLVAAGMLRIELIVLMAAAVPNYDIAANQRYDLSRSKSKKTVIYFSRQDKVLKWAFSAGQSFSSTNPTNFLFGREAVALRGIESAPPPGVEQIELSHDHGDYWRDRQVSLRVMQELDGSWRPLSRRVLVPRELDSGHTVPGRTISGRQIRDTGFRRDCACP